MVATYNSIEVIVMESTAVLVRGHRLMIDVYKCGECSGPTAPIAQQVYFEDLVFHTPAEKKRARKTIMARFESKKVKKSSRSTNGCIKR